MQTKRKALPALPRGKGRCEKCVEAFIRSFILPRLSGFVQWATGAVGCSIFWAHGIMWALHMEQFNFHMMALSAALLAISAYMEVTHNENV